MVKRKKLKKQILNDLTLRSGHRNGKFFFRIAVLNRYRKSSYAILFCCLYPIRLIPSRITLTHPVYQVLWVVVGPFI